MKKVNSKKVIKNTNGYNYQVSPEEKCLFSEIKKAKKPSNPPSIEPKIKIL